MKVSRINFETGRAELREVPIMLNYGSEPLIFVLDQSSTCTGLTVGNERGQIREIMTFERENRGGETVEGYLEKLDRWLKVLVSNCNVIDFSNEKWISTRYNRSDQVTKQVYGKVKSVFETACCKDENGEVVELKKNAVCEDINNNSWKSMIVPKDYMQYYKDDKIAYYQYATTVFPPLLQLKDDASASFCMYLYLIKTKHGTSKLKASRAHVNNNHSLVLMAFPFEELSMAHEPLRALGDGKFGSDLTYEQKQYMSKYRMSVVKRYLSLLSNKGFDDEYVGSNRENIDFVLGRYLKLKPKEELAEMMKESTYFDILGDKTKIKEIDFNDDLTVEENFRCFTGRDKNIYFMVLDRNLHYCYTIPMFKLLLGARTKILLVATRY